MSLFTVNKVRRIPPKFRYEYEGIKRVALLRFIEEDNLCFLYRLHGGLGIIPMNSHSIIIPDSISRKFIRSNFVEVPDITSILFNIGEHDSVGYSDPSDFALSQGEIYHLVWNDICERILAGSISLVSKKDIFKNRSK